MLTEMHLRLLYIAPFGTCEKQTVQRRLIPLGRALAARGHEIEVIVPAWDCPQQAGRDESDGVVNIHYPRLGPAPHRLLDIALLKRITDRIGEFDPDIVHVFKPIGYSGVIGASCIQRGRKVIVDQDDLETDRGWGKRRNAMARRLGAWQEGWLMRRAAAVTTASKYLQTSIRQAYARTDTVHYLANGVTLATRPISPTSNASAALLYTRGNDIRTDVADIWQRILTHVPDARLYIVGDWSEPPKLASCDVLGWLQGKRLDDALSKMAVALFPVADTDLVRAKSPARLLDCMALGLPIVTTSVGEYAKLVGLESGMVAGSSEEFVERAASLLGNPDERRLAGEVSRQRAHEHAWERRAEALESWYLHCLKGQI